MALKLQHVIAGAPLTNDATPNATAPVGSRVFRSAIKNGHTLGGAFLAVVMLENGTSGAAALWMKAPELDNSWVNLNPTPVALAAPLVGVELSAIVPPDAELFVQLTSLVGAPTRFALLLL